MNITCNDCGFTYNTKRVAGCPLCTSRKDTDIGSSSVANDTTVSHVSVSSDEKLLQAIYALIEEQKKTRFAIRWSLFGLGIILLVAFYGIGVKVNLPPMWFRQYP